MFTAGQSESNRFPCVRMLSRVQLFDTQWTVAHQAPLSMGFPRQKCWNGLPCSPSEDLSYPGIKPESPLSSALQMDSLPQRHLGSPQFCYGSCQIMIWQFHLLSTFYSWIPPTRTHLSFSAIYLFTYFISMPWWLLILVNRSYNLLLSFFSHSNCPK